MVNADHVSALAVETTVGPHLPKDKMQDVLPGFHSPA